MSDVVAIYPAGKCSKCGQDAWALRPDSTGYYCSVCISPVEIDERYWRLLEGPGDLAHGAEEAGFSEPSNQAFMSGWREPVRVGIS